MEKDNQQAQQRRRDVVVAGNTSDSVICWGIILCFLFFFVVAIIAAPRNSVAYHSGYHHDDDDHSHSWGHSHDDDDDDDDSSASSKATLGTESATSHKPPPPPPPQRLTNVAYQMQAQNPTVPHSNVLHSDYTGSHAKYTGCVSDMHRAQLTSAATIPQIFSEKSAGRRQWPKNIAPPMAHATFDEISGKVVFTVETPYISDDAFYLLAFDQFEATVDDWKRGSDLYHSPSACQSRNSSSFAPGQQRRSSSFADEWAHAPNALYDLQQLPEEVTTGGGAYATSGSKWHVSPINCARVRYTLSVTAEELGQCSKMDDTSSVIVFERVGDEKQLVAVSGVLWLNLLWPKGEQSEDGVEYMHWPFSFSLYVDTFESKVSVTDVPGGAASTGHTVDLSQRRPSITSEGRQKALAKAKEIIERKAMRQGGDDGKVSTMDLHLGMLQWRTFSTLKDTWFSPQGDMERFGKENIEPKSSQMQKTRALRMQFQTTTSADIVSLLGVSSSKGPGKEARDAELVTHIEQEAAKLTPVYDLIGFSPNILAHRATDMSSPEGHFMVAEADFIKDSRLRRVQCKVHGTEIECSRNWTIVLQPLQVGGQMSGGDLYQDAFEVRMCDSATKEKCSIAEPGHRVFVDVAVTDPSLDVEEVEQMQIELSSHLNEASSQRLSEKSFRGGDRVCMQSFAVGPPRLMQGVDLRTVSAWLCVANKVHASDEYSPPLPVSASSPPPPPPGLSSKDSDQVAVVVQEGIQSYLKSKAMPTSGCNGLAHHVQLFDVSDGGTARSRKSLARFNVTVHEPGAYGSWSSVVCFNTSAEFKDSRNSTVYREIQYYQTEVVAVPTEKRRDRRSEAMHRTFSSFATEAIRENDSPHRDHTLHRAESVRAGISPHMTMLTSPQLGQMLHRLDSQQKVTRFNAVKFTVAPSSAREHHLHGRTEPVALSLLLIIGLIGGCLALCLIFMCLTNNRLNNAMYYTLAPPPAADSMLAGTAVSESASTLTISTSSSSAMSGRRRRGRGSAASSNRGWQQGRRKK